MLNLLFVLHRGLTFTAYCTCRGMYTCVLRVFYVYWSYKALDVTKGIFARGDKRHVVRLPRQVSSCWRAPASLVASRVKETDKLIRIFYLMKLKDEGCPPLSSCYI